jgi:hypothetical protein
LKTNIPVKGVDIHGDYVVVWSGKKVEIYEVKDGRNVQGIAYSPKLQIFTTSALSKVQQLTGLCIQSQSSLHFLCGWKCAIFKELASKPFH